MFRTNMNSTAFSNLLRIGLVAACILILVFSYHSFLPPSDSAVARTKPASTPAPATPAIAPVPVSLSTDDKGSRPLIVYVYAESETARSNLDFFISNGLHDQADFVFVFNGETDMIDRIPKHPHIATVQRENTCFDLGAVGEVLRKDDLWKRYKRFITMNASVRGPFLPVWTKSCWSELFLGKVTDKVKLVGTTLNCAHRPHVQSMVWATDDIGMRILLDPELATVAATDDPWATKDDPVGLSGCYADWGKAVHSEVGTTALVRSQGYEVDVMMTSFSSEKDIDAYCAANKDVGDVQFNGGYFGTNLHPYEILFIKANRNIDHVLIDRLSEWQKKRGFSSWESCKAA